MLAQSLHFKNSWLIIGFLFGRLYARIPSPSVNEPQRGDDPLDFLEGTATVTGEQLFEALVENLAKALHTDAAWVRKYSPDFRRLKALAFYLDRDRTLLKNWERDIAGNPWKHVIKQIRLIYFPYNLLIPFPIGPDIIGITRYHRHQGSQLYGSYTCRFGGE